MPSLSSIDGIGENAAEAIVYASKDGPYLSKAVPKDPWGNEYTYVVPGENGLPYGICSYGKDGMEGGEGNDADIKSWE